MAEDNMNIIKEPRKKSLAKRYTNEQIEEAIVKYFGNRTMICDALKCSQKSLSNWIGTDSDRKKLLDEARSKIVDTAEAAMYFLTQQTQDLRVQLDAAKYLLSTQGRSRGYGGDSPSLQIYNPEEVKVAVQAIFNIKPDDQQLK